MEKPIKGLFFIVFIDKFVIMDTFDKIIYYNMNGEIIHEHRLLNAVHPHEYFNIRNFITRTIKLGHQDYQIIEASIDYVIRQFGTQHITHLKLSPFVDGQHS